MKQYVVILLATLCLTLSACSDQREVHEDESEQLFISSTPTIENSVETDASAEQGSSGLETIRFSTQIHSEPNVEVAYIEAADRNGSAQETLNKNLREFYLWQWLYPAGEADETITYHGTADYAFIGNRLLSVQRYLSVFHEGAAYPVNEVSAQSFDISTGEPVGPMNEKPLTDNILQKFHLTSVGENVPEELTAKASQALSQYAQETEEIYTYFLTDTGVAIYLPNDVHAEGDYFIFEAKAEDVSEVLSEPIRSAFGV